LKIKTSAFDVKTREKKLARYLGFDAAFEFKTSNDPARFGPGTSLRPAPDPASSYSDLSETDAVRTAADIVMSEPLANSEASEAQVSRVAGELFSLASPMLAEYMPCELRLMGVRVASFRGAQATLERGQQRIGKFFETGTVSQQTTLIPDIERSSFGKKELDKAADRPAQYAKDAGSLDVVDICDSDEEMANFPQQNCDADIVRGSVPCPVCGANVMIADAEAHVNAHYDSPSVNLRAQPAAQRATKDTDAVRGQKRKNVCTLLQWAQKTYKK